MQLPLLPSFLKRLFWLIHSAVQFHMNIRIHFSISAKKYYWDFDMDCIESVDNFGEFGDLNNV